MKYAVIYARYSSERQTEQSIEGQLTECHSFAEKNELVILDTYIDRATTGTNDNRAAFQQMLSDAEKDVPWEIVLVYAIDRFGRNSIEIAVNKQRLKKNGKMLISATQRTSENIDGSKNLDGILLENVYIGLAEYYSAELSQKIRRGLHESRTKGLYCGGIMPYGYKKEPVDEKGYHKRIVEDEVTAPIVRYIFQSYANGMNVPEIIDSLTAQGIFYLGKPFVRNTVYKMLRLEKYIGIARYSEGVFTNIFPPLVDKDIFDRVQVILDKFAIGGKSQKVDYLLRGKLFCGKCGKPISGEKSTSKSGREFYYYKCSGRKKFHICDKATIAKDKIENLITEVLMKEFGTPENQEYIVGQIIELNRKRLADKSLLRNLRAEKEAAEASLRNIMKAVEDGFFTKSATKRANELEDLIADLEERIAIAEFKEEKILTPEQVRQYLSHTIKMDPALLIRTLIQKIVIDDEKIEIHCNYCENMPTDPPNDDSQDFSLDNEKLGCAKQVSGSPPLDNKANSRCKPGVVLFITRDFFGIKINRTF